MTTASARSFWERKVAERAGHSVYALGRSQDVNNVWASIYCTSKWLITNGDATYCMNNMREIYNIRQICDYNFCRKQT
jgi:hypothetical protein